jgi:hypothetical protein
MTRQPLHHQAASDGRGGIPGWWFGAPAVAFAYAFLAGRVAPDLIPLPEGLPAGMAPAFRWFVGLLLGVALLSVVRLALWARHRRSA